jgi:hypothetical protein
MNADESLAQPIAEELPWLAFLYVSEEMTPDEVVDFEERLLTDQAAREAVAEAMKMADGLWLATALESWSTPETPAEIAGPPAKSRSLSRWALWMGSTIALAGLAFCVGWWFAQTGSPDSPPPLAQQSEPQLTPETPPAFPVLIDAGQLIGIWSNARVLLAELDTDADADFSSEEETLPEALEPEDEAFAWMLAAVSANPPEASQLNPDVMEN